VKQLAFYLLLRALARAPTSPEHHAPAIAHQAPIPAPTDTLARAPTRRPHYNPYGEHTP
jgi:hypothetical protein